MPSGTAHTQPPDTDPQVLTATEVADRLTEQGIPVTFSTVARWMRSKKVPSVELPSGRRVMRLTDYNALVGGLLQGEAS